jgi:hypothetical protein
LQGGYRSDLGNSIFVPLTHLYAGRFLAFAPTGLLGLGGNAAVMSMQQFATFMTGQSLHGIAKLLVSNAEAVVVGLEIRLLGCKDGTYP